MSLSSSSSCCRCSVPQFRYHCIQSHPLDNGPSKEHGQKYFCDTIQHIKAENIMEKEKDYNLNNIFYKNFTYAFNCILALGKVLKGSFRQNWRPPRIVSFIYSSDSTFSVSTENLKSKEMQIKNRATYVPPGTLTSLYLVP